MESCVMSMNIIKSLTAATAERRLGSAILETAQDLLFADVAVAY